MLSMILSTLVFFAAAWYLNRYLNEQEIAEGLTRRILVLVLATVVSLLFDRGMTFFDPPPPPTAVILPAMPPL